MIILIPAIIHSHPYIFIPFFLLYFPHVIILFFHCNFLIFSLRIYSVFYCFYFFGIDQTIYFFKNFWEIYFFNGTRLNCYVSKRLGWNSMWSQISKKCVHWWHSHRPLLIQGHWKVYILTEQSDTKIYFTLNQDGEWSQIQWLSWCIRV